jgi:glutamate-1-semialdehyde aminotransferase
MKAAGRDLSRSAELLDRAHGLIPAWTQTLSKNPTQWMRGVAPAYLQRAEGAHVWDVDGNEYIDWPMALGPVILGHGHPGVNEAVRRQLDDGVVFTLPHRIELEVAEEVRRRVPCAERVRFGKSGSDANSAAVRVARAFTGRDGIVCCGYHGWHDWFVGTTSRSAGVPEAVRRLTDTFDHGDLESLDRALTRQAGGTALVILEPAGASVPSPGFLEGVVERAHAAGALVCFDEVVTGFRFARGGAQERYGILPDLATFGKALGNGFPISAVTGRGDVMDLLEDVFFSGTHGGEALSLAAALATLDALTPDAYAEIERKGTVLRDGLLAAADEEGAGEWISVGGEPPFLVVKVREPDDSETLLAKSLVQQEMLRQGVLFNGTNFVCLAHTDEDLERTLDAYRATFRRLAELAPDGIADALQGPPLSPAFRSPT